MIALQALKPRSDLGDSQSDQRPYATEKEMEIRRRRGHFQGCVVYQLKISAQNRIHGRWFNWQNLNKGTTYRSVDRVNIKQYVLGSPATSCSSRNVFLPLGLKERVKYSDRAGNEKEPPNQSCSQGRNGTYWTTYYVKAGMTGRNTPVTSLSLPSPAGTFHWLIARGQGRRVIQVSFPSTEGNMREEKMDVQENNQRIQWCQLPSVNAYLHSNLHQSYLPDVRQRLYLPNKYVMKGEWGKVEERKASRKNVELTKGMYEGSGRNNKSIL